MGEQRIAENTCKVVAIFSSFQPRHIECVGPAFLRYLTESKEHDSSHINVNEDSGKVTEREIVFEDDVEYLRSLDPKEWKDQDHYAVLGMKKLRFKATEDDLKRAYRQKVLRHHPDKRKAKGEEIQSDDDYFTCITKAYEILGNPIKRRSYDSVDPEFDDSLPSANELKKDFYKVFNKYFSLNSRWSEKKNVPKIGDDNTPRQQVEKFYSFWYAFESWREFSYDDEEEKEKGQDREERRWIEKQNKVVRAKRKKEEMSRIRSLVDLAYNNDPRIAKFKQDEKDRKLAAKRAKQDAVQARKDEEERIVKEAQLAKERSDAVERSRIEAIRSEREVQKRALKKERKILRDCCKANEYYTTKPEEMVEHMSAVEKICEMLKTVELQELNKDLKNGGRRLFLKTMKETNDKLEAERRAMFAPKGKAAMATASTPAKQSLHSGQLEWTQDSIQLLIKAVNLFPAGTNQRWEVIANFLNQHGSFEESNGVNAKDVLSKAKSLQNTDFSKNSLKTAANDAAFDSFEKDKKTLRKVDNTTISVNDDKVVVNGVQNGIHEIKKSSSRNNESKTTDQIPKLTENNAPKSTESKSRMSTEHKSNLAKETLGPKENKTVKSVEKKSQKVESKSKMNKQEENKDNPVIQQNGNSKEVTPEPKYDKIEVLWSKMEQELLEQAIKTYPVNTPERWDKISECIPNRSKKECMRRFKELVDMVKAKKQAKQLDK